MNIKKDLPIITIVWTGYVWLTTALVIAKAWYKTYCLDVDEKKIEMLKSWKPFFFEVWLEELVSELVGNWMLIPTTSYEKATNESTIFFSCVWTPDNPDGSSNLSYVFDAAKSVAKLAKNNYIYVQKSTVPVWTWASIIKEVKKIIKKNNKNISFSYVSNPEFLREGSALYDTLNMDRLVLGSNTSDSRNKIYEIYEKVDELSNKFDLRKIAEFANDNNPQARTFSWWKLIDRTYFTSLESAELIKVSANAFLALKISFANEIAKLCDATWADINEVMDGVGSDHRIWRAFLYAGRWYWGWCFPKDVSWLIMTAKKYGVEPIINIAGAEVNNEMPKYIVDKIERKIKEIEEKNTNIIKQKKKVLVLWLAFKLWTSDTRKSPWIKIANIFQSKGYEVFATDPKANSEAKETLNFKIQIIDYNKIQNLSNIDIIVVTVNWKEFLNINYSQLKGGVYDIFCDATNTYDKKWVLSLGYNYIWVWR